jgi:cystathionine beta-lyase/cystathionine gamma-synthase
VHAGERPNELDALDAPLVLSSTFALGSAAEAEGAFRGENSRYVYGRWRNPTVEQLEAKVAALEAAEEACATASGMAAVSGALLAELRSGDHVVAPVSCYGETARLLRERLPALGIETTFVDAPAGGEAYRAALRPTTRLLYVETPANPVLAVTDIAAVVALGREHGLVVVADNTFATPYCQQPILLGADLVLHSMTKSLGGHGDAIGGIVCGSAERIGRVREVIVKGFGGVLAPFNAFLIARGLRTLALRQAQACASARRIAAFLEAHPAVARVHYPGLASHPGHDLAVRQMRAFGSLVAFDLGDGIEAARRVLDRVELIAHAVSLGDVRSLLTHPATTTAASMPAEQRNAAGIGDGLLRLSVGIEDAEDLLEDLGQALA